ncbi:MAG: phosphoribulokinase [Anaerolineae bacterium]|nr:MAG: phosphoribulokinase [Anaerolineae bacterium]
MPFKRTILLGIVGDSAAGKSTLSAGIAKILGEERVTVICTDDYHRYNRKQRKELGISALDPACNYINIMEQHLDLLRRGHPILKPIYNHSTGDFDPPEYIEPREFIIAEGLLGFYSQALRRQFDVKVYLAPEEDLRIQWKIARDTTKRGYTPEQVLASLKKRQRDSERFIHPQQAHADIVVTFYRPPDHPQATDSHLNVKLKLRPTLPHPNLADIVAWNNNKRVFSSSIEREDDWLMEILDIKGEINDEQATQLEDLIWERVDKFSSAGKHLRPDQIGVYTSGNETHISHPLGITQLLIVYQLMLAREELEKERASRIF